MNWTKIEKPYLYGYEARNGDKRAEVVRAYVSTWCVFRYVKGTMLRNPLHEQFSTMVGARAAATRWLVQ